MKKYQIAEGNELRGFRVRLYPTKEQLDKLAETQDTLRIVWNHLVSLQDEVIRVRGDFAVKAGLVGQKPIRPIYDGMEPETAKQTKNKYDQEIRAWYSEVHKATSKNSACAFRSIEEMQEQFGCKQDYQFFAKIIRWKDPERSIPGAHILQALGKNLHSKGPKRRRKPGDPMPIQVRSGKNVFSLGEFGSRRNNPNFYNCQVFILGLRIKGRLPGKNPEGRILEGVSLVKESDGWYASIRVEVPKRIIPTPTQGTKIGIDVGLDNIVAMSDGNKISYNKRLQDRIRIMQTLVGEAEIRGENAEEYKRRLFRLQTKYKRWSNHVIYNDVIKALLNVETIVLEKLNANIGHIGGSSKLSSMRKVRFLLLQRFGENRVREVDPCYTSQDCSQCGKRSKETWSYHHGRFGVCPSCGHTEDRDINAARNVLRKYTESLAV